MSTSAHNSPIIRASGLTKAYHSGEKALTVLDTVSFEVNPGKSLAIVGPSGSGKTTLLGLCAGLDTASSGDIELLGTSLPPLSEDARADFRGQHIGFVFQNFQLIPTLSALENVSVPLDLRKIPGARERAKRLLESVGLGHRLNHLPLQLSGGEQQRVALARAFVNAPKILFADEPTGNLDGTNGNHVTDLLFEMNREKSTTLVLVTHDLGLAEKCDGMIRLRDGKLISESAA